MIISIEGIDGAGKSTLAARLSEELGFPVLDLNKDMLEPYEYAHGKSIYSAPCFDRDSWKVAAVAIQTLDRAGANAILDRTTLSCWAYQQRNDANLEYLAQVIKHVKPVILMLDTDVDICLERDQDVIERGWGYDDLVYQKHRMLAASECFARAGVPIITLHHLSNVSEGDMCKIIVENLKEMNLL